MTDTGSFPALAELKREAEGMDSFIEQIHPLIADGVSWLFEMEYLEKKGAILEQRDTIHGRFVDGRQRIESTYGSVVARALRRRDDGAAPRLDVENLEAELDDARAAIDELYEDLDEDYLTQSERRELSELTSDIIDAREYARNVRTFADRKPDITYNIGDFNERFAPYKGGDCYMITSDQEYLEAQSATIYTELTNLARELKLHILPNEDADWLAEQKTRFAEITDTLPDYNRTFVERERERYTDLFETKHGPLNDKQQKAIVRDNQRNLVDASAGTGKTLTLTYRFLYLLKRGVPASKIAAITYTGDAAEEMKTRIAAATDITPADLNISTIHSFARQLYRETITTGQEKNTPDLGDERTELIERFYSTAQTRQSPREAEITHLEAYEAFKAALDRFDTIERRETYLEDMIGPDQSRDQVIRLKLEEFIEEARTFGRSPEDILAELDGSKPIREAFGKAGAALLDAYLEIVERRDEATDFDDMIESATRAVKSYPDEFASRYSHLLVDEFQDVSPSTLEFVEAFLDRGDETHLFSVGDDWQSIFGFTGSDIRYFTTYEREFENVTYTQLEENYRCPPSIVRAGTELMRHSQAPQNQKTVRADSDLQMTPEVHSLIGLYKGRAAEYAAERVDEKLSEGHSYDDIMVLSRNDKDSDYMRALRQELEKRKIPHKRPKKIEDYLPQEYVESLESEIVYKKGDAQFAEGPDKGERPPMVLSQSIHASKGTEAPVVILLHAVDADPDGLPSKERTDTLIDPASEVTAAHVPEQRRLFYVALTRTEEEFLTITAKGRESRYIKDIREHFVQVTDEVEAITGKCTWFEAEPESGPIRGFIQSSGASIKIVAWPDDNPPILEKGSYYFLSNFEVEYDEEFGEQVWFGDSHVTKIEREPEAGKLAEDD